MVLDQDAEIENSSAKFSMDYINHFLRGDRKSKSRLNLFTNSQRNLVTQGVVKIVSKSYLKMGYYSFWLFVAGMVGSFVFVYGVFIHFLIQIGNFATILHADVPGDCYVGRLLCGVPRNSTDLNHPQIMNVSGTL
jgi:hypothetical protein